MLKHQATGKEIVRVGDMLDLWVVSEGQGRLCSTFTSRGAVLLSRAKALVWRNDEKQVLGC